MKSRVTILGTLLGSMVVLGCTGTAPTGTTATQDGSSVKSKLPKNNATPGPKISPQIIKPDTGEGTGGLGGSPTPVPVATPTPGPTVTPTDPPPAGDWFGRVLGVDGKPAVGVTVKGFLTDGTGTPLETKTDDKGMFTLKEPASKALNLEAAQSDSVKAFQPNVAATAKNVTMQLAATGTISGKIQLDGGTAAGDVTVLIPGTSYTVKTAADGTYTIANVPAGTFTVHAEKAGAGAVNITNVAVSSGGTAGVEAKTLSASTPTVASVTPAAAGPTADLTIKGDNFAAGATVTIGNKDCTDVKVVDAHTITAKVALATPSGKLVVKLNGGVSEGVDFKVIGTYVFDPLTPKKLLLGDKPKFKVTAQDTSGSLLIIVPGTWASSVTSVADVAQDGTVTAKAPGDTKISISSGTAKGEVDVHVDAKLTVTTYAGSGAATSTDGVGTAATFNHPTGLALDGAGSMYVADNFGNCIRRITMSSVSVSLLAGSGNNASHTANDGSGAAAGFFSPQSIIYDGANGANRLIIDDQANFRIRAMTTGGAVTTIAGGGAENADTSTGGLNVDGAALSARFYAPADVAFHPTDHSLYIADYFNHRIKKLDTNGNVTTIAGTGATGGDGGGYKDDANPMNAMFKFPLGLVFDAAGNLYVADQGNTAVRKIAPNGAVSTLAGGGASGFADGKGNLAQFRGPNCLLLDKTGTYLYAADTENHAIRRIRLSDGDTVTVLGGSPTGAAAATSGFADGQDARFKEPNGMVFDATTSTLYITDAGNNRIRAVVLP
ncbi:MAG: Serine/threonine-protein kinase PknD [Cyanobacteria bacterium RYN_339]|nr:Serine/threonine-protein kinase PknD [Cyanobacteria bacterium RYN_339]